MLNKGLLLKEFEQKKASLFPQQNRDIQTAHALWHELCTDTSFLHYAQDQGLIKTSTNDMTFLGNTYTIEPTPEYYGIVAVDGSQIYPDKHQGTTAFLLNCASVTLWYGFKEKNATRALFTSAPHFFPEQEGRSSLHEHDLVQMVNIKRDELEWTTGLTGFYKAKLVHPDITLVVCFDGSLFFLSQHIHPDLSTYSLKKYTSLMEQYAQQSIPLMGYVSLPKSQELVELLKKYAAFKGHSYDFSFLTDTDLAATFLIPGTHSAVFQTHHPIHSMLPHHLKPHFFYLCTQWEIARIEVPGYVTQNTDILKLIASVAYDLAKKGNGYPAALAQAHENTVITGSDRDFFYQLLKEFGIQNKRSILPSQKALKKKFPTI